MSTLTRYLRIRIEVSDGVLHWEVPRSILGVWPMGVRHVRAPVTQILRVRVRSVVYPLRLLVGPAGIVVPLLLDLWWVAVPAGLIGLWVLLLSFGLSLEVQTHAGARHRAGVCLIHRMDAELYAAAVNDLADRAGHSASGTPPD